MSTTGKRGNHAENGHSKVQSLVTVLALATATPSPSLIPSPLPSPLKSPILVQLVDPNASPVWLAPLLTGVFVLIAALVALLSLRLSDRRKLDREDRRQWDREMKDSHAKVASAVHRLERSMMHVYDIFEAGKDQPTGEEYDNLMVLADKAYSKIATFSAVVEIPAPNEVINASNNLGRDLEKLYLQLSTADTTTPRHWGFLNALEPDIAGHRLDLMEAVRAALRLTV